MSKLRRIMRKHEDATITCGAAGSIVPEKEVERFAE
jgi:hypothetical protein